MGVYSGESKNDAVENGLGAGQATQGKREAKRMTQSLTTLTEE